jgi:hypothetical protein
MKYRIRVLPRADADLRSMAAYIHARSRPGAAAWLSAFEKAKRRLEKYADSFAECQDSGASDCMVRELGFRTPKRAHVSHCLHNC